MQRQISPQRPICMAVCLLPVAFALAVASADESIPTTAASGKPKTRSAELVPRQKSQPKQPATASAAPSAAKLSPGMASLRDQIRKVLAAYHARPVNARDHTPWEVFHWIIAYNVDADLYTRGPGGEKANAVAWLCSNHPCRGQQLLKLEEGRVAAAGGVGLEGHTGQFLAILGQSRVMANYPLYVGGKEFTVSDLVETQKLKCKADTELTFQLISLAHYLDLDDTWTTGDGQEWSIPRIIREEIGKPIHGSACGGTHRLMGLSYSVKKRQKQGKEIDGEYRRAQVYVEDYIQYTLRMQNTDGSFSTEWFAGRGNRPDVDRRVQTTGHILEWLVFAASDEQLRDPRIVKAVDYLTRLLASDVEREWKIGPLGHALRSLSLYDRRVFKPLDSPAAPPVARRRVTKPASAATNSEESDENPPCGPEALGDAPECLLPCPEEASVEVSEIAKQAVFRF